ncbi:MAG: MarR family transcriptional regulator [bacterium]|nr:MarR family transcriptional regulator [bacterium]
MNEIRVGFHTLVEAYETVHRAEEITVGMRAVLEFVDREGPRTVPDIARSRRVSRQHIQTLANPLEERGLVEFVENPAHRRSPLVALTVPGANLIARMRAREAEFLKSIRLRSSSRDFETATEILRSFREDLIAGIRDQHAREGD